MSKLTSLFSKVPVRIQNRSGFDMSHYNNGTLKVGELTPVLCEPLCPNDKVSLGVLANLELPPMATNFIGRVDLKLEAFFVPNRLCWKGWQRFFNYFNEDTGVTAVTRMPKLNIYEPDGDLYKILGAGTLMDYLGFKMVDSTFSEVAGLDTYELGNPLPLIGYHLIYDRWYRDKILQRPLFMSEEELVDLHPASEAFAERSLRSGSPVPEGEENFLKNSSGSLYYYFDTKYQASLFPYTFGMKGINTEKSFDYGPFTNTVEDEEEGFSYALSASTLKLADGSPLFGFHKRNYAKDYFTASTPKPQAGDPVKVSFSTAGATGNFSIASLRAAAALQRFSEKYNIAGSEYCDQINAVYGIMPADAVIQHPVYLGSTTINVYNRSVVQTATAPNSQNPFKSVGTTYGKSSANGSNSLVGKFTASEHGYLFVIASLVPHSFYGTGIRRHLLYNTLSDFPIPDLAGVGDQPIYQCEVAETVGASLSALKNESYPFGYTGRYSEAKFVPDSVHGLLRDDSPLQHFAIQRTFDGTTENVQVGSDFIEIKDDAMDNVSAVLSSISDYGAWYTMYFNFKKSSILPAYSIPTLEGAVGTHTEMIDRGGKRL